MTHLFAASLLLICAAATPGLGKVPGNNLHLGLNKAVFLKITPTSLLDPEGVRLPVGIEYFFSNSWSVSAEASIPFLTYSNITNKRSKSQRSTIREDLYVRLDVRKYYTLKKGSRLFMGLEGFWRNQELVQDHGGYYYTSDGFFRTTYSYKSAEVFKNIFGGGMFFGGSIRMGSRVFFEPYVGLGLRTFNAHRRNVEGLSVRTDKDSQIIPRLGGDENRKEGQAGGFHVPFGIKISIQLGEGRNSWW
jgi:hypothetical protein